MRISQRVKEIHNESFHVYVGVLRKRVIFDDCEINFRAVDIRFDIVKKIFIQLALVNGLEKDENKSF